MNAAPVNVAGDFVLLWMVAARRTRSNFATDRALDWSRELGKPILLLEALRLDYPFASDRLHRFVLQGMGERARALAQTQLRYYPYVELEKNAGSGLLEALSQRAAVVITDDFPCFFIPKMVAAAANRVPCRLEAIDSNGIVPISTHSKDFKAAAHFRRSMQGILRMHLPQSPDPTPLNTRDLVGTASVPQAVLKRWPAASENLLAAAPEALSRLALDHEVFATEATGGEGPAQAALRLFVQRRLHGYPIDRNHPDRHGTSRLSPYLHFGMLSAHDIFAAVSEAEEWTPTRLSDSNKGARAGWWGMSEGAEAFLDQLIIWRELGYNTCAKLPQSYRRYASLPEWAKETLHTHETDERPYLYERSQLETAQTHDPVFNAAMRQLREEGWLHGYLRMLWGKKILEWSPNGRTALSRMEYLMNRWSLDGRNPNSYSGYFWTLGRYDRGWPERAIYGKVRCMTSKSTRRKVSMEDYLQRYGEGSPSLGFNFDRT